MLPIFWRLSSVEWYSEGMLTVVMELIVKWQCQWVLPVDCQVRSSCVFHFKSKCLLLCGSLARLLLTTAVSEKSRREREIVSLSFFYLCNGATETIVRLNGKTLAGNGFNRTFCGSSKAGFLCLLPAHVSLSSLAGGYSILPQLSVAHLTGCLWLIIQIWKAKAAVAAAHALHQHRVLLSHRRPTAWVHTCIQTCNHLKLAIASVSSWL